METTLPHLTSIHVSPAESEEHQQPLAPLSRTSSNESLSDDPKSVELHLWKQILDHLHKHPHQASSDAAIEDEIHHHQGHVLSQLLHAHMLHPWDHAQSGLAPHKSRIARGPFHLHKYAKAKDVMVPTGLQATLFGTFFNLLKCIIGAGILSLPLSYAYSGFILETIILVVSGILMWYTCVMLLRTSEMLGVQTYEDTAMKSLGHTGAVIVDLITIVGNFLYLVAYLIVLGDFGVQLLEIFIANAESQRMYVIIVLGALGCYPLSLLPSINSLRFTSILALVATLFFMLVVVVKACMNITENGLTAGYVYFKIDLTIFQSIPLAIGAYSCHVSIFPIIEEMKERSLANSKKVLSWAYIVSFLVFFLVALFGYIQFGPVTKGNLLNNYSGQGGIVIPVIIIFAFVVITTYPLVNFTCRIAVSNMIFRDHKVKANRGYFVSTGLFVGAVLIALFVKDLALILDIVGSVATSAMTLILPGLMFYKAVKDTNTKVSKIELWGSIGLVILGVVLGILGLVTTFMSV